jgi:hypothetical protein
MALGLGRDGQWWCVTHSNDHLVRRGGGHHMDAMSRREQRIANLTGVGIVLVVLLGVLLLH